jgi:hypothetical protein
MRLRHYGLLSNRDRDQKLALCRELLEQPDLLATEVDQAPGWKSRYAALTGEALDTCPSCHVGRMRCVQIISRGLMHHAALGQVAALDFS